MKEKTMELSRSNPLQYAIRICHMTRQIASARNIQSSHGNVRTAPLQTPMQKPQNHERSISNTPQPTRHQNTYFVFVMISPIKRCTSAWSGKSLLSRDELYTVRWSKTEKGWCWLPAAEGEKNASCARNCAFWKHVLKLLTKRGR